MQDRKDAGKGGFGTRVIWNTVKYRVQVVGWTGGMKTRRNPGLEGCRTGGIQERWDAGEVGCRKGEMQESRDEELEGFLTVGT